MEAVVLALTAMDHSWTLALAKAYEMARLGENFMVCITERISI
jgi:hypothetical protein